MRSKGLPWRIDMSGGLPALVWLALSLSAGSASSQLIDSTLDDVLDEAIDREVAEDVGAQIESGVVEAVEEEVAAGVAEAVEGDIASGVVETIEQQVESGVTQTIEQTIESGITQTIGGALDDAVGAVVDELELPVEGGGETATEAVPGAGDPGQRPAAASERFFVGLDALGRDVEREVWVILVPAEFAARIPGWGFTIRERQDLGSLERVLLRVDAPEDRDIAQAALDLALDAPGTLVDFNHLYRGAADEPSPPQSRTLSAKPSEGKPLAPKIAIGLVDTAVAAHEALRRADIVQQDFVPFASERPTQHGTAVASILVGDAPMLAPRLQGGRLYAAGVFFADADGAPAATTASLVAALEWLAAQGVRTVNMSLSGPPNRVLEAAIGESVARGAVIVAAVGNNGPAGEPLYPAAYSAVVGITAVDGSNRIYRRANRGPQVMFAAPGVRIKVARSAGGYATQSGTSMAAPYAAAIIAEALDERAREVAGHVLTTLQTAALDLGAKDFDDVYGFGLITSLD